MKKLLFILAFIPVFAAGQVINTTGIVRVSSAPTHAPTAQGAKVAIDTTSGLWYEYEPASASWREMGFRVQLTYATGAPNYTPGKQRGRVAVNLGDSLYVYQSGEWSLVSGGGAGPDLSQYVQFADTSLVIATKSDLVDTATVLEQDTILIVRVNGEEVRRDTIRAGGVTGTGTANYVTKFTGASTIGNSGIRDSVGLVAIGGAPVGGVRLDVTGPGSNLNTTAFRVRNSVGTDLMAMKDGGDLIVPNVIRSQVAASINSRLALSSATFGGNGTVAIGAGASVAAGSTYSMAIGVESAVQGTSTGSTAIGRYALVNASDAYSLGNRVINTFANSFLAGQGSGFLTNDLVKNRYANSFGIGVNTNIATLIVRGMQAFFFTSITVIGDTITTSASHNRVVGEPIIIGVGVNTHFTRVKAVISSTQFTVDTAPAFASTNRFKAFVSDIVEVNDGSAGDILLRFTKFGQLSIGSASPNASAKVEIQSTTRGLLPPRMTTAQRDAIATPAAGLMVYDTTVNKLSIYNGTEWKYLQYE